MILDRAQLPPKLRKGPAVGFLILTEFLAELRIADSRLLVDWDDIEHKLRELQNALDEYLALEDLDHELALELVIHRDRVACTLDSWERGSINSIERSVLSKQERYVRERQRAAREGRIGKDRRR